MGDTQSQGLAEFPVRGRGGPCGTFLWGEEGGEGEGKRGVQRVGQGLGWNVTASVLQSGSQSAWPEAPG